MALTDIPFKPGLYANDTDRGVGKQLYWKSADKVRFFNGLPQKIGGWRQINSGIVGVPRTSIDWQRISTADIFVGIGTHLKLMVWSGGQVYDITPIRLSGSLTNPFTTTNTSAVVSVDHVAHGNLVGDYVHFSGATAVGGITISGEYTVAAVTSDDVYTITHTSAATSSAGPGGSTVTYQYEIHVGEEDSAVGTGYGSGTYGSFTYGTPRSLTDFLYFARIWALDTWGEDMIACPRGGAVYVWDASVGLATRATVISQAPSTAKAILVSQEDRHLIALGAHSGSADNPLLIRWCDSEDYTVWTPAVSNTAGDKLLDQGNEIYCGIKVRGDHLIFTDSHIYALTFVGPPDTFATRPLGTNGGLAGPNAVKEFEGIAYWMGVKDFFFYDGSVQVLPCTVVDHVFDDFNDEQVFKIYAGINLEFREVWWLYPSADSDECNRYVMYNITDKAWSFGTMARTVLIGDSDVMNGAYGMGTDGYFYQHEFGTDADTAAMTATLQSGDVEVDPGGNQLAHISRLIPDFKVLTGSVNLTLTGKKYPQASETQTSGPHAITSSTKFINPRMRCRQISITVESIALSDNWRMGMPRVDLIPHGGR